MYNAVNSLLRSLNVHARKINSGLRIVYFNDYLHIVYGHRTRITNVSVAKIRQYNVISYHELDQITDIIVKECNVFSCSINIKSYDSLRLEDFL